MRTASARYRSRRLRRCTRRLGLDFVSIRGQRTQCLTALCSQTGVYPSSDMLLQTARSVHGRLGAFVRTRVAEVNRHAIEKCDGMGKERPVVGAHLALRSHGCWNNGVSAVWACVSGGDRAHFVAVLQHRNGVSLALSGYTLMRTQLLANLHCQNHLF